MRTPASPGDEWRLGGAVPPFFHSSITPLLTQFLSAVGEDGRMQDGINSQRKQERKEAGGEKEKY